MPSSPGPLNLPFLACLLHSHLENPNRPALAMLALQDDLSTDASTVVHHVLTVVCIVNSYKLGDSTHTHKKSCGLGKSETWRDELMSHHPAVDRAEQRLSL